ncbi:MAG: chitobiase/beta-hexosaminidase C-terminal domain-containing protein, partial [Paramuribaculum sp.]|nr:chitobiase/beta-hexosaminidase C-terminal domain-containing protein [Paramuribaculum sp.]
SYNTNKASTYWNQTRADANIKAIKSFDDPTELTDVKPKVSAATLGDFQGLSGAVNDVNTVFEPTDKSTDLGEEFFLEVNKDGCIGLDGTSKIDLVNCADDAFRFTHIEIGIVREVPTGAPELTLKSNEYKETTTDDGSRQWIIWDYYQTYFSINEKYGNFDQLCIKYLIDYSTEKYGHTPADLWSNSGCMTYNSSSLVEVPTYAQRIWAVGQHMTSEIVILKDYNGKPILDSNGNIQYEKQWNGTGEYTPVSCVEIKRISNRVLADPAEIVKQAKNGDIVTLNEFGNMIGSTKIGDKYVAFIRQLSEGTIGGHTLKLVSDVPFPDSWRPAKPSGSDQMWDRIIARQAIQGLFVKTAGDHYLMVKDDTWDFTSKWIDGQFPSNVQVRRTNPGSTATPEYLWVHSPNNTAGPKSTYPDDWYNDAPGDCSDLTKVQLYAEQRVLDLGNYDLVTKRLKNTVNTNKVLLTVDCDAIADYWEDTSKSFDEYMTEYKGGRFALRGIVDAPIGGNSIFNRIIYPRSIEIYPKGMPKVKNFTGSAFDIVTDDTKTPTTGVKAYKFLRLRPVTESDPITLNLDPSAQWTIPAVDYIIRTLRDGEWITLDTIAGGTPFNIDSDAYFDAKGVAHLSFTPIIDDLTADSLTVEVRNILHALKTISGAKAFKEQFAEGAIAREAYTDLKGRFVVARKHRGTLSTAMAAARSAARSRSMTREAEETTWLYLRDLSDTDSDEYFMIHGDNLDEFNEGDIFTQLTILPERFDGNVVADINGLETLALRETDAEQKPVTMPKEELASLTVAHRMDLCAHEGHTHYAQATRMPEKLQRYDLLSLMNVGVRVDAESGEYFAQLAEDLPIGFHIMGGNNDMIAEILADKRGARLNLHGIVITGSDGRWILELERAEQASALKPTVISMTSGGDDADGLFATYATAGITTDEEGVDVYYRREAGDYMLYVPGTPIELDESVMIESYSCRPGISESPSTVRRFVKTSIPVRSVADLVGTTASDRKHHVMCQMVIAEVLDNVMMAADAAGRWITLWNPEGWGDAYTRGDNIRDFVVDCPTDRTRFYTIDPDYMPIKVTDPEAERLRVPRATVRELISDSDVGMLVAMQGGEISTDPQGYTVRPEANHSIVYNLNPAPLGLLDWMAAPEGEVFVITSYVMTGPDGSTELWPIRLDAVRHTYDPEIITDEPVFVGETTFTVESELGAYVWWSTDGGATWEEYPDAPVTIDRTCTVSVYAQLPGLSDSQTVSRDFTREYVSGDVEIQAAALGNGYVDVEIVPMPGQTVEDAYRIYCTTDGSEPQVKAAHRYNGSLRLRSTAIVKALMVEEGKRPGAVNACEVIVPQAVSGLTKIHFKEGDGITAVIITPFYIIPEGSYSIYYTTDGSEPKVDPAMLYDGSALMLSEPCTVKALLLQDGMLPGEVISQTIRIVSGIAAPDSDPAKQVTCSPDGTVSAPEGSRLYDTAGRQLDIKATLRKGVYIVVTPDGKAVKILVR